MGGNLFKVGRVTKERYDEIVASLKPILDKHFGNHYRIPVAYASKPDYGDVDIILDAGFLRDKNWIEPLFVDLQLSDCAKSKASEIENRTNELQSKRIRNVISVLYMNFQVDFFCVGTSRFEMTYHFMSYNILGNLLGRIFHKFNLKYGEDGLKYVFRGFNDRVSKEVYLSRDMREILGFLGLSYTRWTKGFNKLEEIFDYIIDCKYFTSNSYDEKYFNVRKRSVERPDFNTFLDYLKEKKIEKNYPFVKEKERYIPFIESQFPKSQLIDKYEAHLKAQVVAKEIAEKFNGRVVMRVLEISDGKAVGDFIYRFKKHYEPEFENYIQQHTQDQIDESIRLFNDMLIEFQGNQIN
jgi:hypothetical protein